MTPLVVNHPLYTQTVKNLERTVVRDKLLRLAQYLSRFLTYYTFRKGYSMTVVNQFKALMTQLSLARKAFRAGKPLGAFRLLAQELSNETNNKVLHLTTVLRNLGSGVFLSLDTLQFLHVAGAYKFRPATAKLIQDTANRFWLLSLIANIVEAVYKTQVETQRIKVLAVDEKASPEEIKRAHVARHKSVRMLVWNVLDAFIPSSSLGLINVNDGFVGLAGTITAYLGLRDAW